MNLIKAVQDIYNECDEKIKAPLSKQPISCKKGCYGCCYQCVSIGPSEAIYIASMLIEKHLWDKYMPRLTELNKLLISGEETPDSLFIKKQACLFLENGLCSIYEHRPFNCRYYYVTSPGIDCYPDNGVNRVTVLDSIVRIAPLMIYLDECLIKSNPKVSFPARSPLPLMILWALSHIID